MEASEEGAACPAVPPRRRRRARAAVSAAVARCPMPLLCALFGGAAPKREVQRAFISISQSVEAVHPNSAVHPKGEDEPALLTCFKATIWRHAAPAPRPGSAEKESLRSLSKGLPCAAAAAQNPRSDRSTKDALRGLHRPR